MRRLDVLAEAVADLELFLRIPPSRRQANERQRNAVEWAPVVLGGGGGASQGQAAGQPPCPAASWELGPHSSRRGASCASAVSQEFVNCTPASAGNRRRANTRHGVACTEHRQVNVNKQDPAFLSGRLHQSISLFKIPFVAIQAQICRRRPRDLPDRNATNSACSLCSGRRHRLPSAQSHKARRASWHCQHAWGVAPLVVPVSAAMSVLDGWCLSLAASAW